MLVSEACAQRHAEPIGVNALLDVAETRVVEIIQLYLVEWVGKVETIVALV